MIQRLLYYESPGFNPYRNLAIEECLLEQAEDAAVLYLWQNENTVVIGRNQNPWKECNTALLEQEGGRLARRQSGGGAVFHDLGNLNFTVLLPREDYDLPRQLSAVGLAMESLGIPATLSGRNDLLAEGKKFSGSAFYKSGSRAYHHGTLLIRADMEKLGRYLTPSRLKLQSKGVDSVRSRVENLCHWRPDLTVEEVKKALQAAFSRVYGLPLEPAAQPEAEKLASFTARNQSWDWNYGKKLPFTCTLEGRFPWGGVEISLVVEGGTVRQAKVFTDAMQAQWVEPAQAALEGCPFRPETLCRALTGLESEEELCKLINMSF